MTELELLKRLRWTLNDEEGVVWQDDFLLRALRRAAVEYYRRVPLLYGWTPVMPDEDNVYRWPPDFAAFFYGINHYCEEILPATPRRVSRYPELYDEDKKTWHPPDSDSNKWIEYDELIDAYLMPKQEDKLEYYDPRGARTRFVVDHGNHTYTPYPDAYGTRRVRYLLTEPEEGVFQGFTATEGEELPEQAAAADSEYGVVAEMDFGEKGDKEVFVEPEFGTLRVLAKGICSGNLKYVRCDIENWELADPRGVVHYAAHIAFQQENDRKNPELSDLHLQLFNKFVAMNTNHKVRAVRTQPAGVFF